MENKLLLFTGIEFEDDPNVKGYCYWYWCPFEDACVGDYVIAPLGRHNNTQKGIIRKIVRADEDNSPYPFPLIKKIRKLIKK
ncbi:MAG: hypothetical protein NC489_35140 [Ruminococcus flavefaciens]|nr:hypothetical protein [Ruminococcus flavefaciens]